MLDALISTIRDNLRNQIMESIKPDIELAVNESIKALKINIDNYRDCILGGHITKIIVDNKIASICRS